MRHKFSKQQLQYRINVALDANARRIDYALQDAHYIRLFPIMLEALYTVRDELPFSDGVIMPKVKEAIRKAEEIFDVEEAVYDPRNGAGAARNPGNNGGGVRQAAGQPHGHATQGTGKA